MYDIVPIVYLIIGVILLSILVSLLTIYIYGPRLPEKPSEVVVAASPYWYENYPVWWGYYGSGLPGWGGGYGGGHRGHGGGGGGGGHGGGHGGSHH